MHPITVTADNRPEFTAILSLKQSVMPVYPGQPSARGGVIGCGGQRPHPYPE